MQLGLYGTFHHFCFKLKLNCNTGSTKMLKQFQRTTPLVTLFQCTRLLSTSNAKIIDFSRRFKAPEEPLEFVDVLHPSYKQIPQQAQTQKKVDATDKLEESQYESILAEADQKLGAGDYFTATQLYTKLIHSFPQKPILYAQRGKTYSLKGELNLGLQDLNRAIELDNSNAVAYYDRAVLLSNKRRVKESQRDYDSCISLSTDNDLLVMALNNRGFARMTVEKDMIGALEDLKRAVALKETTEIKNNLASVYMRLDQYNKALPIVESLFDNESTLRNRLKLIECLKQLQLYEKLTEHVNAAIDQLETDCENKTKSELKQIKTILHELYKIRARVHMNQGSKEEAFADLSSSIRCSSRDAQVWTQRASLLMEQGKYDEATFDLTASLQQQEAGIVPKILRAECYEALNQIKSAILDYESVVNEVESKAELHLKIAELYIKGAPSKEDVKQALFHLRSAIDSSQRINVDAHYQRAMLYNRLAREYKNEQYKDKELEDYSKIIEGTSGDISAEHLQMRRVALSHSAVIHFYRNEYDKVLEITEQKNSSLMMRSKAFWKSKSYLRAAMTFARLLSKRLFVKM